MITVNWTELEAKMRLNQLINDDPTDNFTDTDSAFAPLPVSARSLLRYQAKVGRHLGQQKRRTMAERLFTVCRMGAVLVLFALVFALWQLPEAARLHGWLWGAFWGLAGAALVAFVGMGAEGAED